MDHPVIELPPAYPLAWPEGWARTSKLDRLINGERYRVNTGRAVELVSEHMRKWDTVAVRIGRRKKPERLYVVTTNAPTSRDGRRPLSGVREPEDPGASIWWVTKVKNDAGVWESRLRAVACDNWRTVAANIRACGIFVESLRAIERSGASEIAKHVGWAVDAKLPVLHRAPEPLPKSRARKSRPARTWWETELDLTWPYDVSDVQRAYRRATLRAHPDQGGSHEQFIRVCQARDAALEHLGIDDGPHEVAL